MKALKSIIDSGMLTYEMIHTQSDRVFIPLVLKELEYIKTSIINSDTRNGKVLVDAKDIQKSITKLSEILSDRFGFQINVIDKMHGNISTTPIYPPAFNVLNGGASKFIESLTEYFSSKDLKYLNAKNIFSFDKNVDDVYNNIYKSYKTLKEHLIKNNVVVDNKNAKIYNLPKDYNVFINIDFTFLLNTRGLNLTAEMLLGTLLHEIGHVYTSFEKSILSVYNTVVLLDTIKESINNKNEDPINIIKITMGKISGEKNLFKDRDTISALIAMKSSLDGYNFADDKFYQNSRISAEQQADQFVSRFGYAKELTEALVKLGINERMRVESDSMSPIGILLFFILFILFVPAGAVLLVLIAYLAVISDKSTLQDFNKYDKLYDTGVRRLLRIKQDSIRQMRLLSKDIDKDLFKRLEDTILVVDANIKILTNSENKTFLNKYFDKYQYDSKTKKVVNMLEITEELMENDLHYLNLKLKQRL